MIVRGCHPITKGDCMFSNTSFNSDKEAVQSGGPIQLTLVDSKKRLSDVERGKRCICQLLSRNDQSIPIQLEEKILELSNTASAF